MRFTLGELETAVINRLELDGYSDEEIENSPDIFIENYALETLRDYDVPALSYSSNMAGIGKKLKKAVKKVKKAVKKVVKTVAKPVQKVQSKLGRKLLPDKVQKLGRKIDRAVIRPALLPVTVAYKTPSEVKQTVKDSMEVAQRTLVPDAVYQAAKKFEQKHRPLLKQIAYTVGSVVASFVMGPGAITFAQIAMQSIKQLAIDLVTEKVATRIAEAKAKKDQKAAEKEIAAIQAEIAQLQAETENELALRYQSSVPALVSQNLSDEQQAYVKQQLETVGESWLDTDEAQQLLGPIISQLSAQTAAAQSDNALAPVAAEIAANEKKSGIGALLPIGLILTLLS